MGEPKRNTHHTAEGLQNEIRNMVPPVLADGTSAFQRDSFEDSRHVLRAAFCVTSDKFSGFLCYLSRQFQATE